MSRQEILKKINSLENEQFCLAMKDHWNGSDFAYDKELSNKIRSLQAQLQ